MVMFSQVGLTVFLVISMFIIAGCQPQRPVDPRYKNFPDELIQILHAVQDSAAVETWIRAFEEDRLPPLVLIPRDLSEESDFDDVESGFGGSGEENSNGADDSNGMADSNGADSSLNTVAHIDDNAVHAVSPVSTGDVFFRISRMDSVEHHSGPVTFSDVQDDHLAGNFDASFRAFELRYRLPSDHGVVDAAASATDLRMVYDETTNMGSLRQMIGLTTDSTRILLFYLSDGSTQLYVRTISELHLTISQNSPTGPDTSLVTVQYRGEKLTLDAGESVRTADGETEFVLIRSLAPDPGNSFLSEGLPYYVILFAYRVL